MGIPVITVCDFHHAGSRIPSFELLPADVLILAVPWENYTDRIAFMEILSGQRHSKVVQLNVQADLVVPFSEMRVTGKTVREVMGRSIETQSLEAIADALEITLDSPYEELQLTPRTLLRLATAEQRGSKLTVLTTSGLDPLGVNKVLALINSQRRVVSSIIVDSHELVDYNKRYANFSLITVT